MYTSSAHPISSLFGSWFGPRPILLWSMHHSLKVDIMCCRLRNYPGRRYWMMIPESRPLRAYNLRFLAVQRFMISAAISVSAPRWPNRINRKEAFTLVVVHQKIMFSIKSTQWQDGIKTLNAELLKWLFHIHGPEVQKWHAPTSMWRCHLGQGFYWYPYRGRTCWYTWPLLINERP